MVSILKKSTYVKLWNTRRHLKIEAATLFYYIPGYLMMICMSVFELEKACRVNLNFDTAICDNLNNARFKDICATIIDKSKLTETKHNVIEHEIAEDYFNFLLLNETEATDTDELSLIKSVCHAEKESQKLLSKLYAYRSPITTTFTLIIVMFAGAWSDKYQIRKPFILIPILSEIFAIGIYLVSAIYMETIPAEYSVLGAGIIPALTGGPSLFMIGAFSYITVTTAEDQRTFRFGCFSMFMTVLGIIFSPLSGPLFKALTYVQFFLLSIMIYCCAALYVYFFIQEVKYTNSQISKQMDVIGGSLNEPMETTKDCCNSDEQSPSNKNMFLDFFDPKLIVSCIEVLKRPRQGNTRKILFFAILCRAIFCITHGESGLVLLFTRTALRWTTEYGLFVTFYTAIELLGTGIVTVVFVKMLHIHDATLGAISIVGSLIAYPIFAFSTTTTMAFLSTVIDMFFSVRYITNKSTISKFVETDELGRVYSILSVISNLDMLVFAPIYSIIYYNTIDFLPGAIFLFSEFWLACALVLFIVLRILSGSHDDAAETRVLEVTDANICTASMSSMNKEPDYDESKPIEMDSVSNLILERFKAPRKSLIPNITNPTSV